MSLAEHLQILEAHPTASLDEIRTIYRDLAQVWHPDRFQNNPRLRDKAEQKLKAINQAYEYIRENHPSAGRGESSPVPRSTAGQGRDAAGASHKKARPSPAHGDPDRESAAEIPAEEADALGWYAVSAMDGHADAQCIIATMYSEGTRVDRDENKATFWFRKAAQQGHAAAEFQVGLRYYSGHVLPKDQQLAFSWYQRAALQGHSRAQFNLGLMSSNGQVVPQDRIQAYAWFKLAASGGHADAAILFESARDALTPAEQAEGGHLASNLAAKIKRRQSLA